jgi:hypothetical protein
MPDFVNPYTFLPHVVQPDRRSPAFHLGLGVGCLTGSFAVSVTVRTPLLIGGFLRGDGAGAGVQDVPRRGDGAVMIPGSGLHGAIRSLHEALTGSCLRVLDASYVPVHRQGARPGVTRDLRLAVVVAVDDRGLPARVALCGREVWVDKDVLANHLQGPLRTGDRFAFPEDRIEKPEKGNRHLLPSAYVAHESAPVRGIRPTQFERRGGLTGAVDQTWVLLVTDTRARDPDKRAWFVAGKVDGRVVDVAPGARAVLSECLVGADDLRPAHDRATRDDDGPAVDSAPEPGRDVAGESSPESGGADQARFVDVKWPPLSESTAANTGALAPRAADAQSRAVVGQRLRVSRRLHVGQPVWVRLGSRSEGGDEVVEVRLSQLWRAPGRFSVGERVGAAVPCDDPEELCPSCRVFGSADTEGRDEDEVSRQRSYRGHVRVEDAVATGEVTPLEWDLAPLSSPRPSAGQFYLDNAGLTAVQRLARSNEEPIAQWGSKADPQTAPRAVRGRKFYWRTTSNLNGARATPNLDGARTAQTRGARRGHHTDAVSQRVHLVPAGTVFTTVVRFENLSPAEVGSVAAAIDPRLLWPGSNVVTSVGGGKPFGFGAVTMDVRLERVETAASRYLGADEPVPTLEGCVSAFRGAGPAVEVAEVGADGVSEPRRDPGTVTEVALTAWPSIRNVLTLDYVDDAQVWYPPGEGARGTAEYDRGFDFWKRSTGITVEGEERALVCLPSPAQPAAEQVLRLRTKKLPRRDDAAQPARGRRPR